MGNFSALLRKELHYYLNSAIAYGIAIFYLVITTLVFIKLLNFSAQNVASMRAYFSIVPFAFILIVPAFTMRLWAEERRAGTHELLLTMPYTPFQLVLAKWLSGLILIAGIMVLTLPLPIMLSGMGSFDFGVLVTQYLGTLLYASAALAIGTFVSSLSKNQIMAFLGTFSIMAVFTLIDYFTRTTKLSAPFDSVVYFLSLNFHFESFSKGLLDSRDVLHFAVITLGFLFLSERRIVLRKWS